MSKKSFVLRDDREVLEERKSVRVFYQKRRRPVAHPFWRGSQVVVLAFFDGGRQHDAPLVVVG